MPRKTHNVAVVGTGTMGPSIALIAALNRHETVLVGRGSTSLDKARTEIDTAYDELAGAGLLPPDCGAWRARLRFMADMQEAVRHASFVIDAIAEDIAAKQVLFQSVERWAPETAILASSTSGLAVDDIAAACTRTERVAVAHFANPPHLMPAVEIVPGSATDKAVIDALCAFVSGLGKEPVRLIRDVPGHIFNRLQFALMREAFALVRDGVATAEEVDRLVKHGYALRLAEEGPLEKADLAGLPLVASVARYLFPDLDDSTSPEVVDVLIAEGRTGAKAGKGFHDWTPARAEAVIAARNQEVIRHLLRRRRKTDDPA